MYCRPIKFLYSNVNGYSRRKILLNNYIENNSIDCVMIVETKTTTGSNVGYKDWFKSQRNGIILNKNARGGSAILGHPKLNLKRENAPYCSNPYNDILHVSMPLIGNEKLHIFLAYIHPLDNKIEENLLIKASQYDYAIIIGDLNMNSMKSKQLSNFCNNSNFCRIRTPPTFLMTHNPDSTPDVLLCTSNIENMIANVSLSPDLGADHLAIELSITIDKVTYVENEPIKRLKIALVVCQ